PKCSCARRVADSGGREPRAASRPSLEPMTLDLFDSVAGSDPDAAGQGVPEQLGPGAVILRGAALPRAAAMLLAVEKVTAASPFRLMTTPGGFRMSVAMTNCGAAGWITDRRGYRYDGIDPLTGQRWPAMPDVFMELAAEAAGKAGYPEFAPDACL